MGLLSRSSVGSDSEIKGILRHETRYNCPLTATCANIAANILKNAIQLSPECQSKLVKCVDFLKYLANRRINLPEKRDALMNQPRVVRFLASCYIRE